MILILNSTIISDFLTGYKAKELISQAREVKAISRTVIAKDQKRLLRKQPDRAKVSGNETDVYQHLSKMYDLHYAALKTC